ncbi:hypothetical protein LTS10_004754 [Elasticomyces elasticus]|nr:hypothetical protein LTS10_004754 [Elasticomyces elasticus]
MTTTRPEPFYQDDTIKPRTAQDVPPGDAVSSIQVMKRTDRSLVMLILQHLIKPFGPSLVKPKGTVQAGSQRLDATKKAQHRCEIHERRVEEMYMYDMVAKGSQSRKTRAKRIYYFAGGGWQSPPAPQHWALCAEMASKMPEATVSMVSYPLAPHSAAPVAMPELLKWYHTVLREAEEEGERVIFAGDSAGGNVILSLTLYALLQDPEARAPAALMAISPSTDLTRSNPDMRAIEKHDPILRVPFVTGSANAWRGEWDATDPRVSPLYAAVSILAQRDVKVHGISGTYDILGPDAVLFRKKCKEARVRGEWLDWDKQMHCFALTWSYGLSEGKQAKEWMLDVLRRT